MAHPGAEEGNGPDMPDDAEVPDDAAGTLSETKAAHQPGEQYQHYQPMIHEDSTPGQLLDELKEEWGINLLSLENIPWLQSQDRITRFRYSRIHLLEIFRLQKQGIGTALFLPSSPFLFQEVYRFIFLQNCRVMSTCQYCMPPEELFQ